MCSQHVWIEPLHFVLYNPVSLRCLILVLEKPHVSRLHLEMELTTLTVYALFYLVTANGLDSNLSGKVAYCCRSRVFGGQQVFLQYLM